MIEKCRKRKSHQERPIWSDDHLNNPVIVIKWPKKNKSNHDSEEPLRKVDPVSWQRSSSTVYTSSAEAAECHQTDEYMGKGGSRWNVQSNSKKNEVTPFAATLVEHKTVILNTLIDKEREMR